MWKTLLHIFIRPPSRRSLTLYLLLAPVCRKPAKQNRKHSVGENVSMETLQSINLLLVANEKEILGNHFYSENLFVLSVVLSHCSFCQINISKHVRSSHSQPREKFLNMLSQTLLTCRMYKLRVRYVHIYRERENQLRTLCLFALSKKKSS